MDNVIRNWYDDKPTEPGFYLARKGLSLEPFKLVKCGRQPKSVEDLIWPIHTINEVQTWSNRFQYAHLTV